MQVKFYGLAVCDTTSLERKWDGGNGIQGKSNVYCRSFFELARSLQKTFHGFSLLLPDSMGIHRFPGSSTELATGRFLILTELFISGDAVDVIIGLDDIKKFSLLYTSPT
jgi:hypothetical protein